MLRPKSCKDVSWSKVYNRWCEFTKATLLRNTNPFLSCLNLTESCKNMSLCLTRKLPRVVACTTTIGKEVLERHECAEILDSTYKTNSSKFELFALMESVLGAGVPIAYMFLQPGTQVDWDHDTRGVVLNEFLQSLKVRLLNLKPKLFFTDKNFGQIYAIKAVFGITSSIYLWHMKRAVKMKIAKLYKKSA